MGFMIISWNVITDPYKIINPCKLEGNTFTNSPKYV
jgi:hypothetical protein